MTMCSAESSTLSSNESSNNSVTSGNIDNNNNGSITPTTKSADTTNTRNPNRRSNKPIMEKRRRARINNCLNELKGILLEAMRKDPARHSKLEKADILELTVSHLKGLHRNQNNNNNNSDGSQYRAGFTECAAEVGRFLQSPSFVDGIDPQISNRLLSHLTECMNNPSFAIPSSTVANNINHNINNPTTNGNNNTNNNSNNNSHHLLVQQQQQHQQAQPNPQQPTHPLNINSHVPSNTPIISLVPSRLSSGEIAFVVPGFNSAPAHQHYHHHHNNNSNPQHHHHHHQAHSGSSSTPSPTIPHASMQSLPPLHCNPAMLSPEVPLELTTVPSSSSSGCSLSPVSGHGSHYYYHHHPTSQSHHYNGGFRSYSPPPYPSQPLALVTQKKEETENCWRPWG